MLEKHQAALCRKLTLSAGGSVSPDIQGFHTVLRKKEMLPQSGSTGITNHPFNLYPSPPTAINMKRTEEVWNRSSKTSNPTGSDGIFKNRRRKKTF